MKAFVNHIKKTSKMKKKKKFFNSLNSVNAQHYLNIIKQFKLILKLYLNALENNKMLFFKTIKSSQVHVYI
jgi:hypothetical protein